MHQCPKQIGEDTAHTNTQLERFVDCDKEKKHYSPLRGATGWWSSAGASRPSSLQHWSKT